jgi:peptidyl-prolyl cis-trans isomerase-like 3
MVSHLFFSRRRYLSTI